MRTPPPAALAAAGLTAGVAVAVARRRSAGGVPNPAQEAPPTAPPPLEPRERTVTTEDGVALSVHEHGPEQAAATLVLAHGYVQSSRLWHGQVRDLRAARPDLKVVTYDHRGHGRSGKTSRERATLEQLARDLDAVLDEVAPTGPVVLAGHSMGGMTIMALAEERPELFGDRVAGVAFVGTSGGGLADVTWGLPRPVAKLVQRALPTVYEAAVRMEERGRPRKVGWADRRLIFPRGADRSLVQEALDVHRECSSETVAAFYATFSEHDRLEALAALADVPAAVVVGDQDVLCPLAHSQALAAALPAGRLTVFPGVGHMVHMERREEVSRILADLVDRALAARPAAAV